MAETKRLSDEELREIEQRAERATPGPWKHLDNWRGVLYKYVMSPKGKITDGIDWYDAEFIAHAREDIPRLVAEVRLLRKALVHVKDEISWVHRVDPKVKRAIQYINQTLEGGE